MPTLTHQAAPVPQNLLESFSVEQRLQGVRPSTLKLLLAVATFFDGNATATVLAKILGLPRSTVTGQLSELVALGVLDLSKDPSTIKRTNPTHLYKVNPQVDLNEMIELFGDRLPEGSQALIETVRGNLHRTPLIAAPADFQSDMAKLVTVLTRKVVDLTDRLNVYEQQRTEIKPPAAQPDLTEAFLLLEQ
jgi:predicted transcriptional regulator